jgi:hypothetical protein
MKELSEQAIKLYFKIVSDYCEEIISYFNSNYYANITDVPSLLEFKSTRQIWHVNGKVFFFHGGGCSVLKNARDLCRLDSLELNSFDSSEYNQICSWDFSDLSSNGLCVDEYKIALTLKNIEGYQDTDVNDYINLLNRMVEKGIAEKTSHYRIKKAYRNEFYSEIKSLRNKDI